MEKDLVESEKQELQSCEAVIERGLATFYEVGTALLKIRDERLYRSANATFEEYCRARWQMSRNHAHRMIDAARVAQNLLPMGNIPQTERQVRPLAGLEPEQQRAVWEQAVSEANGQPSAAQVEEVSKTFKQVFAERVAAREQADPPSSPETPVSEPTIPRRELAMIRERMRVNSERVHQLMNFIRAIETLGNPSVPIADVAHEILEMDTPDKNWRGQASVAKRNLSKLVEELAHDVNPTTNASRCHR